MKALLILVATMMIGSFAQSQTATMQNTYQNFIAYTKSDVANILDGVKPVTSRGIMVGTTGDLAVSNAAGTSVTITKVAAGVIHPIRTNKIWSTGTTASEITVFY